MNKLFTSAFIILLGTNINFAQVGIGTETPQAMLDVAGTVLVQGETTLQAPLKLEYIDTETVTTLTEDHIVLIADLEDEKVVKRVSLENLAAGLNIPNVNAPDPSLFSAWVSSDINLLTITLGSFGYRPLTFPPTSHNVTSPALSSTYDYYTAPSDGIYRIDLEFRLGSGLSLGILSSARLGLIHLPSGSSTYNIIAEKGFANVSLTALLNVTLSETELTTMLPLNTGDRIYFGLLPSGLNIDLLSSSQVSVNVMKVAGLPQ